MSISRSRGSLRLGVDAQRLLQEFPSFFTGWSEAMTELVQNAFRAGASRIEFASDVRDRSLLVRDNGPGVPDPEVLITAGSTGWSGSVIEPAGLGFFALLGCSERLRIESRLGNREGWALEISNSAWHGGEIACQVLPANGNQGLTIKAVARQSAVARRTGLSGLYPGDGFRHYFPLEVRWTNTDASGIMTVHDLPVPEWPTVYLDSPPGRLFRAERNPGYLAVKPIWEYRLLNTDCRVDLTRALYELPQGDLVVKALGGAEYLWVTAPCSGIRPKLPDRRELIENEAYFRAVGLLARALYDAFNIEGMRRRATTLGLKPILRQDDYERPGLGSSVWADGVAQPIFGTVKNRLFLEAAGYVRTGYTDLSSWGHEYEDDTKWPVHDRMDIYAREPLQLTDSALANALTQSGVPAVCKEDGISATVKTSGLKYVEGLRFAICGGIEVVDAAGNLLARPEKLVLDYTRAGFVCGDQAWQAAPQNLFLIRALAEEGLEFCRRDPELLGWVVHCLDDEGKYGQYYGHDARNETNYDAIRRLMIESYVAVVLPEFSRIEARHTTLWQIGQRLQRIRRETEALITSLNEAIDQYPEMPQLPPIREIAERFVSTAKGYRMDVSNRQTDNG